MATYRIVNSERVGEEDVITVEKTPGRFAAFFGATVRTMKFKGAGKVWRDLPTGRRVEPKTENLVGVLIHEHQAQNTTFG
jgi:hypothetical protein